MEAKGNLCLRLTGTGGVAEVKEDSVCVLKGLGANKQGRKHSRASFYLSYTWVRSLSGVQDRILRSACWKVGKVLPSIGVLVLLPHCLWELLTGGISVPDCCVGVSCSEAPFYSLPSRVGSL